jgi:putative phosphoribosyl transferase
MKRPSAVTAARTWEGDVRILTQGVQLEGTLEIPAHAQGLVLFAHGSGSSRHSSRNRRVAGMLQKSGVGTLLFDLLTREEERIDAHTAELRFDIPFLASRLENVTRWALDDDRTAPFRIGYFGASTGAAAALIAATAPDLDIGAVVSRGGRPDLAGHALANVRASTLLIVGGDDEPVIPLNEAAFARLRGVKRLEIIPGATHLFEEAGALEIVADLAARWFAEHLPPQGWHP